MNINSTTQQLLQTQYSQATRGDNDSRPNSQIGGGGEAAEGRGGVGEAAEGRGFASGLNQGNLSNQALQQAFAAIDADKDGMISKSELQSFMSQNQANANDNDGKTPPNQNSNISSILQSILLELQETKGLAQNDTDNAANAAQEASENNAQTTATQANQANQTAQAAKVAQLQNLTSMLYANMLPLNQQTAV
jgi:EF hand